MVVSRSNTQWFRGSGLLLLCLGCLCSTGVLSGIWLNSSRSLSPAGELLVQKLTSNSDESPFHLVQANTLVHKATRHDDCRFINWSENWVQSALGQVYPPLRRTQNPLLLARGEAANCSERAQILKTLVENSGHNSRFIGLHGHVLLEVSINGQWLVADPDFGVTYPCDFAQLQKPEKSDLIAETLSSSGYPQEMIDHYLEMIGTSSNNTVFPIGSPMSPRLYLIESLAQLCSFLIPLVLLLLGAGLYTLPALWSYELVNRMGEPARKTQHARRLAYPPPSGEIVI